MAEIVGYYFQQTVHGWEDILGLIVLYQTVAYRGSPDLLSLMLTNHQQIKINFS